MSAVFPLHGWCLPLAALWLFCQWIIVDIHRPLLNSFNQILQLASPSGMTTFHPNANLPFVYTTVCLLLTVLDGMQPTVLDNDIHMGLRVWNRLKMFCLKLFSPGNRIWAFTLQKASQTIKFTICQNFIFKKNPDLTGFFIIKPSHPNGLKKTDLGGKKQEWEPWPWPVVSLHIPFVMWPHQAIVFN